MRSIFFAVLCSILLLTSCGTESNDPTLPAIVQKVSDIQQSVADTVDLTTIEWVKTQLVDLGRIKRGKIKEIIFKFKNTGNKPLVIKELNADCGCTVVKKNDKAVSPGSYGTVKAVFDTKLQALATHVKHIYVTANTRPHTGHVLSFKAEVTE